MSIIESLKNTILLFFEKEWIFVSILSIGIIFEIVTRSMKQRLKNHIFSQYEETDDKRSTEYHLDYYKKIQGIDIIRVLAFTLLLVLILISKA